MALLHALAIWGWKMHAIYEVALKSNPVHWLQH